MDIEVRATDHSHHLGILAIAEALPAWFDHDARRRAIPTDLRHQDGFVALSEGRIVGFITLYCAEGRLMIGWLGVHPDFARRGIGTRLLERVEEFGRQQGLLEIATSTLGDAVKYKPYEVTRQFYFKQGFATYQRSATDNPSCPEEIRIKKKIPQAT